MAKWQRISINIERQDRGAFHGYMSGDYASDFVDILYAELCASGCMSWPIEDTHHRDYCIRNARKEVENSSFADVLSVEIEDFEVEEDEDED
jgi:hypothetical protein